MHIFLHSAKKIPSKCIHFSFTNSPFIVQVSTNNTLPCNLLSRITLSHPILVAFLRFFFASIAIINYNTIQYMAFQHTATHSRENAKMMSVSIVKSTVSHPILVAFCQFFFSSIATNMLNPMQKQASTLLQPINSYVRYTRPKWQNINNKLIDSIEPKINYLNITRPLCAALLCYVLLLFVVRGKGFE